MGNYATAFLWPPSQDPSAHGHSGEMLALYQAVVLEIKMRALMLELARYFRENALSTEEPMPVPRGLLSLRGTTSAGKAFRARFGAKMQAQKTCSLTAEPTTQLSMKRAVP